MPPAPAATCSCSPPSSCARRKKKKSKSEKKKSKTHRDRKNSKPIILYEVQFIPLKERVKSAPAIIEFGPGGTGCEEAGAEGVEDEVNGVTKLEEAPPGTEITFTSTLKQADATKAEWTFEVEGKPETKKTVVKTGGRTARQDAARRPTGDPSVTVALDRAGQIQGEREGLQRRPRKPVPGRVLGRPPREPVVHAWTLKHKLEITPGKPVGTFTVAPSEPEVGQSDQLRQRK